jgi:CheY-like chemotaxis protein
LGCKVTPLASDVEEALTKSSEEEFDIAILDVNLNGSRSFRVAEKLSEMHVPFEFATGYGSSGVPATFREAPALVKPFQEQDLREALTKALHSNPRTM